VGAVQKKKIQTVGLGTEEVERTVEDVVLELILLELVVVEEVFDVGAEVEVETEVVEVLTTGGGGA